MNILTADRHVGEVERSIHTIKERLRSMMLAHGLPFKRLRRIIMVSHMIADSIRCINQFPRKNGISATMSLDAIVTGAAPPDHNAMRLEFGSYI